MKPFRVLLAPNAFKGSLSGPAAARAMARGVRAARPRARCELLPIADGGDGLIDALRSALGGVLVSVSARGPLGEHRRASYLWIARRRLAVVEMARASGLALVPSARRDALHATSRGTGDLIRDALRRGAKTVVVGMGGSATSDGGAGMARALGARLLDVEGRELAEGAAALRSLARVEAKAVRPLLRGVRIVALADVSNPLCGPRGSARVFGPQKGASAAQVRILERALERWAEVLARDLGSRVAKARGAGAAGGLGAGLMAFTRARLAPGAEWVLERIGARTALARADLVLTGEGRLDRTSLLGKAPLVLARYARRKGVPCAAIGGQVSASSRAALRRAGITRAVSFAEVGARTTADAMRRASFWAARAASKVVAAGLALALVAAIARAADYSAADQLYWHRDQGGNLEKNIAALDALLAQEPTDSELLWRKGRALVRRGEKKPVKAGRLADFAEAEAVIDRAIARSSGSAEAHFWRGVALGRRGETQGILKSLFLVKPIRREMEEVLRLDPRHGGAHRVLGEILWQLPRFAGGDKKRALAEFEAAVSLSPNQTSGYKPLAEAYASVGRREDAIATLNRVQAIREPDDPADAADDATEARELSKRLSAQR